MKKIFSVLLALVILCSFSAAGFAAAESTVGEVTIIANKDYTAPDSTQYMDYTKTLAATVSASSSYSTSMVPEKAIDGNTQTIWHPSAKEGAYLLIDLGKSVEISKVQWFFAEKINGSARPTSYSGVKLEYSTDGVTYTPFMTCNLTIAEYPNTDGYWINVDLPANTMIRYIKHTTTTTSNPIAAEIKAFGPIDNKYILPNGVTDKTQLTGIEYIYDRASSVPTPDYISNNLIDYTKEVGASASAEGSYGTGQYSPLNVLSAAPGYQWTGTGTVTTKELIVDLGQISNVEYIEWYSPYSASVTNDMRRASNCLLEYSADGITYTPFYKRQGLPNENSWTEMKFKNPVSIRYIRYTSLYTYNSTTAGAAWNIKVWGQPGFESADEYRTLSAASGSGSNGTSYLALATDGSYSTASVSSATTGTPWVKLDLDKYSRIDKIRIVPYSNTSYDSLGDFAVYGVSGTELYLLANVEGQTLEINEFNDMEIDCDRAFKSIIIAKTNDNKAIGALSFCEIKVVEDTSISSASSLYKKSEVGKLSLSDTQYTVYNYTPVEKIAEEGTYEAVCTYRNSTDNGSWIHTLIGSFSENGKLSEYTLPAKTDASTGENNYVAPKNSGSFIKGYTFTAGTKTSAIKAVITARTNSTYTPLLGGDIVGALDVNVELSE